MVHFGEINQAPPPYSMLQYIGRVTCVKKLSQILANNIDNWGRGIGLRTYVKYCLKKLVKNKRGFGKTWYFFSLKSLFLMFGICQMVLGLIGSLLHHFDPQET